MDKIKLLLIAPTFYPVHGGAGLRFYRYLPYFYKLGVETTVICGTPKSKKFSAEDNNADWLQYQDGVLVDEIVSKNAKILKYKIPGKGSKQRSRVLLNKAVDFCANEETKPDVVHVIAPMPYDVINQLKKVKRFGIKLTYSHTIAKEYSSNFLIKLLQQWKVKQVLNQYDRVLVQSSALKDIIKATNLRSDVKIIPNGVDTKQFSPVNSPQEKTKLRHSLNLPENAIIITLVGAVHPRKGTNLLIDAWTRIVEKYPNVNLLFIGPRYDLSRNELSRFKETIELLISKSKMSKNIHFLGQVDCVDKYLKASDMFVFPSEREGMPNAVLEAMSSNLPIVLTPFIGLSKELGVADEHYLLADRNSESLQENILKLISDKSLSDTLALQAREWVINNMTIEKSAERHVEEFQSV